MTSLRLAAETKWHTVIKTLTQGAQPVHVAKRRVLKNGPVLLLSPQLDTVLIIFDDYLENTQRKKSERKKIYN